MDNFKVEHYADFGTGELDSSSFLYPVRAFGAGLDAWRETLESPASEQVQDQARRRPAAELSRLAETVDVEDTS